MRLSPYPFQVEGAKFLATRRVAMLCDEMGLGKSVQAILACNLIRAKRVLVVCPAVGRLNWEREFQRWSTVPRRYLVVSKRTPAQFHSPVYSYDLLLRHWVDDLIKEGRYDVIILDEAHFLKNPEAARTREILGQGGIVRACRQVWALTGTPVPNHWGELWPLLYTFGRTKLKYDQFIDRYCHTEPSFRHFRRVVGGKKEMATELRSLLRPLFLRRTKKAVLPELPALTVREILVEPGKVVLSAVLREELRAQLGKVGFEIDRAASDEECFAVLQGLAQSVATLRRYLGLQKVEPATKLAKEILSHNEKEKMGLFCVHVEVAKQLFDQLSAFGPVVITGQSPEQRRDQAVAQFQNDPECRVFIGNIQAAGTSITLTAGHRVVMVEKEWTPSHNDQAMQRFHRIGQKFPVTVDELSIVDSLDQKINGILRRKNKDIAALIS